MNMATQSLISILEIWLKISTSNQRITFRTFVGTYALFAVLTFTGVTMMLWCALVLIAFKTGAAFHKILVDTTLKAPISSFEKTDTSELLNRFSQDMSIVEIPLPTACFMVLLCKLGKFLLSLKLTW